MSQRTYKQFFYGKNIPKTNTKSRPSKWIPNTFIDTYNTQTGSFRSRRKYGADGYMIKDLDVSDNHRPYDHVHDYNADRRSVRNPTKKEKYEFYKAKKKRRFFND